MKVAFVHLNEYPEIGATDFYELTQAFGRLYPGDVHVIVAYGPGNRNGPNGGVVLHEISVLTRKVWTRASIGFYRRAARLICALEPEIAVVTFDRGAALIPAIVKRRLGRNAPRFVHHVCSVSFAANRLRYGIGNLLTRAESFAFDEVTTISQAIGDEIYGKRRKSIYVVPIGVNLERFSLAREGRRRHRAGLREDDLVFVYVGTLCAEKNVDHIVEAFQTANLGERAKLWLVGDGPKLGEIRNDLVARRFENVVAWGRRDFSEIPSILSGADVAISHIEGQSRFYLQPPIKVLEYLASGLPILATDVPGNRYYLDGCSAARLYAPTGVQALSAAFKSAFKNRRTEDERAAAIARAEAYSWTAIARKMSATLTRCASGHYSSGIKR